MEEIKRASPDEVGMTCDAWREKYKPVHNPIGTHGAWDGCMYETFGAEWEAAAQANKEGRCWTIIEGDNPAWDEAKAEELGDDYEVPDTLWYIVNGLHLVNRIGFLITEVPFTGDFLEVLDD